MTRFRSQLLVMIAAAVAAACGGDARSETAVVEKPPHLGGEPEPWETISPDSLYGATALENITVTPVVLDVVGIPNGWDGMRIAAISDIHLGMWEENEAVATAAIQRAVAENPDIVVLLGDYIARGLDTEALRRVLSPLRGRTVFAVLGDRDIRTDSVEAAITAALRSSGVNVLNNSAATITRNGETGAIVGVHPDLVNDQWATQEYVLAVAGGGAKGALLLAHHPPIVARASEGDYAAGIAGNTVCGPVEVPGTPRLEWLTTEALPGAVVSGALRLFKVENTVVYVTCGVGYGFLPARFGGAPEVAMITLESVEATEAEPEAVADTATSVADSLLRRYEQGADTSNDNFQF